MSKIVIGEELACPLHDPDCLYPLSAQRSRVHLDAGGMCESSRTCPVENCPLNKPLKRSEEESAEEYRERIERV